MTPAEQLAHDQWVGALVMQVLVGVVVPLLVFFALCGCFWFLLDRAQRDPEFDIAQIFRDDVTGKVSMVQILKGGSFVFSTVMAIIIISVVPNEAATVLGIYSGTWGPTAVAFELLKRKYPSPKDG